MYFPSAILPLLFAALAHSAAVPADLSALAEDVINFDTCKDPNFVNCRTWTITTQTQCIGVSDTEWNDVISSIRVPNGYRCRLWSSNVCNGDSSADIYAPGAGELGGMNDKTTSFKCYRN